MMGPDCHVIFLHQLGGRNGNLSSARNHPGDNADSVREDYRTLRSHLPEFSGKCLRCQGEHKGQSDGIGRMAVVNHPISAACQFLFDLMVHQVRGELGSRSSAALQAPDKAVILPLVVNLDHSHGILRMDDQIAQVLAGSGYQEILSSQLGNAGPDGLPSLGS